MASLQDKAVLVTGAGAGIGRATALAMAAEGAMIAAADIDLAAAERGIAVEQLLAEQEAGIPIRRANTPDDIAAMAVFLASPGSRNITGQSYNVDGGLVPS